MKEPVINPYAGIGIPTIVTMLDPAKISVVASGFYHLVGNAIRNKASAMARKSHRRGVGCNG